MFKYLLYILVTFNIYDAVASKTTLDIDDGGEPFSFTSTRYTEIKVHIANHLDPISLWSLLMTSKKLGNEIRDHSHNTAIVPIPFREGLQDEIAHKLKTMNAASYIMEFCHRLPYSFNKVFRAQITWQDFEDTLKAQHAACLASLRATDDMKVVDEIADLYSSVMMGEEGFASFLQDTPERQQAIKNMRPYLLCIFLIESLASSLVFFTPGVLDCFLNNEDIFETAPYRKLKAFYCYAESVKERPISLKPATNFEVGSHYLRSILWQTKIYQEALWFKHGTQNFCPEKFNMSLAFRFSHLLAFLIEDHNTIAENHICLQPVAQITNGWVIEMIEMMDFSVAEKKESSKSRATDNIYHIFHCVASSCALIRFPNEDPIAQFQRQAFYHAEAAAFTKDNAQKALAYQSAGETKWGEAQLWSAETEHQEKADALNQSAFYLVEAANLHTDIAKKATAYEHAGHSKWEEAQLLSAETEHQRKAEAFAQSAACYAQTAYFDANPIQRIFAYNRAAQAKWQEAQLLSAETESQRKSEAFAQAAFYYAQLAILTKNADAYISAALAKRQEARCRKKTDRQKEAEAFAQAASFYAQAAYLYTDSAKKASAYKEASDMKFIEMQSWIAEEDKQKQVDAYKQYWHYLNLARNEKALFGN